MFGGVTELISPNEPRCKAERKWVRQAAERRASSCCAVLRFTTLFYDPRAPPPFQPISPSSSKLSMLFFFFFCFLDNDDMSVATWLNVPESFTAGYWGHRVKQARSNKKKGKWCFAQQRTTTLSCSDLKQRQQNLSDETITKTNTWWEKNVRVI